MLQIKPELRRQDLEGIHLPASFRFSWKLKKLCRVDFFVFESWQTAVKSQGKTITSSAVCHEMIKKQKNRLNSFFNFQENLNDTFQILMSKPGRFDKMHWKWNVSTGPVYSYFAQCHFAQFFPHFAHNQFAL
jgi:hypothetical protein